MTKDKRLPEDIWTVIASFAPIEELQKLVYLSSTLQFQILNYMHQNFTPLYESLFIKNEVGHFDQLSYHQLESLITFLNLFIHHKFPLPFPDPTEIMLWAVNIQYPHSVQLLQIIIQDPKVDLSAKDNLVFLTMIGQGHTHFVSQLLHDTRINPYYDIDLLVDVVTFYNRLEIIDLLLKDSRLEPRVAWKLELHRAVSGEEIDKVKELIQHDNFEEGHIPRALSHAAKINNVSIVKLLAERNSNPNADFSMALVQATKHGHYEIVEYLLRRGLNLQDDYSSAMIRAAEYGFVEIVRLFLSDTRADPTVYNTMVLIRAVQKGHSDIVRLLLDDERITPTVYTLIDAISRQYADIFEMLLNDKRMDREEVLAEEEAISQAAEKHGAALELFNQYKLRT